MQSIMGPVIFRRPLRVGNSNSNPRKKEELYPEVKAVSIPYAYQISNWRRDHRSRHTMAPAILLVRPMAPILQILLIDWLIDYLRPGFESPKAGCEDNVWRTIGFVGVLRGIWIWTPSYVRVDLFMFRLTFLIPNGIGLCDVKWKTRLVRKKIKRNV